MQKEEAPRGEFPRTRHSLFETYRSAGPEGRAGLAGALLDGYWKPVYKLLRIKWRLSSADAEDLTQAFFVALLERNLLERYDPGRARFRTYLRICLDGFVANALKAARAEKRGGGRAALDIDAADRELAAQRVPDAVDPEEFFRREWIRHLFAAAVDDVRARCGESGRARQFALFERCDLDPPSAGERPSYAALASEFGVTVSQVTNHLHAVRAMFRAAVLERLREMTGSEEEFRAEAREVLGMDPP